MTRNERETRNGREPMMLWMPRDLKAWLAKEAKKTHRGNTTLFLEQLIRQEKDLQR